MNKFWQGTALGLVASLLTVALWQTGLLAGAEALSWSFRVKRLAQPSASTKQIKLILLDQDSLDWGESVNQWGWPWPREVLAAMVEYCAQGGARVFVQDVVLSESSTYDLYQDQLLGEAMKQAGNVVSTVTLGQGSGRTTAWPPEAREPRAIEGLAPGQWTVPRATFPVPEVAAAAAALGNVMAGVGAGAEITRIPLVRVFDGRPVPTLGLAAYLVDHPDAAMRLDSDELRIGDRVVPLDAGGETILRYRGPARIHETVSAASVIQSYQRVLEGGEPSVPPEFFTDAYVFYGYSAPALLDLRPTPLSPIAPGVTLHATLLDNLLEGDLLRDVPPGTKWLFLWVPTLAAGWLIRMSRRARHSVYAFITLPLLPLVLSMIGYRSGYWVPVAAPTLGVVLALIGGAILNYALEGRARAFIKGAFQHYLSPVVIDQLLTDPDRLKLGGERRELSILFSDLQGFSSISESMEPQDLVELLNDYLSDMTTIILEEQGTLDKYEGDAIIAFWNAPLDQSDHAERACRAAVRCQQKLAERREEFHQRSGHRLFMRIGINTGPVVVGNMGSHERFDYTVLGDAANLAARLEGANKVFGTFTMVSDETWQAGQAAVRGRRLAALRVVGRNQPVVVHELTGLSTDPSQHRHAFTDAVARFERGDVEEAVQAFAEIEDDAVAAAYLRRCRERLASPAGDWDPVWNLTSK